MTRRTGPLILPAFIIGLIAATADLDAADTCYRYQQVGMCTVINPPVSPSIDCSTPPDNCSETSCAECAGPAWVLTPQPIWGCICCYPRGFEDCSNTGSTVYVKKSNYWCDPTTHCYVKKNDVDFGAGCESATGIGECG